MSKSLPLTLVLVLSNLAVSHSITYLFRDEDTPTTTICPLIVSAQATPSFLVQPLSTRLGFLTGNYSYSGGRVSDFKVVESRDFCRPSAIYGSMCSVLSVIYEGRDPVGRGNMVITYTPSEGTVHTILVNYSSEGLSLQDPERVLQRQPNQIAFDGGLLDYGAVPEPVVLCVNETEKQLMGASLSLSSNPVGQCSTLTAEMGERFAGPSRFDITVDESVSGRFTVYAAANNCSSNLRTDPFEILLDPVTEPEVTTVTTEGSTPATTPVGGGLSSGAIAGIAAGGAVMAVVHVAVIVLVVSITIRKRRQKTGGFAALNIPLHEKPLDLGTTEAITELNGAIPKDMIIDSSLVDVSTIIGQGEFGVVYKGMLKKGAVNQVVAVKSLKGIFVTETDVQNALREILKMKNFDHPNVMTLMGVCQATGVSGGAPSIIMPYMARGSLLSYLRRERDQLMPGADADMTQVGSVQKLLMQICLQISKGMAYLASLRFVHRDLAARNCMIDEKGVIKVSDFGLAEDIYMRNYFRQSSQDMAVKLPLKWMAPESIKLGIFSEKSDVWSYGVTCWEVFTAGEIPYPGIHPQGVVQLLENGQHLSKPKNPACDDTMYGLMNSCWAYRPEDRPKFEELASSLDNELTALAEYVDLSMFADESNVNTASEE